MQFVTVGNKGSLMSYSTKKDTTRRLHMMMGNVTTAEFSRTHTRQDGMETSRAAAALASIHAESIKGKILACIRSHAPKPLGFEEIARRTGLKEGQVWKRISDLKNDKLIEPSGLVARNTSGAKATLWGIRKTEPTQGSDQSCQHLDYADTLDGGKCNDCGIELI